MTATENTMTFESQPACNAGRDHTGSYINPQMSVNVYELKASAGSETAHRKTAVCLQGSKSGPLLVSSSSWLPALRPPFIRSVNPDLCCCVKSVLQNDCFTYRQCFFPQFCGWSNIHLLLQNTRLMIS